MAKHQLSDANAPRRRSALYPSVSIMESLRFTTLIASIGPEVSYEALLEKMGISSHTTRNFAFRLGSSKQYGLVTADGHTILLTDLAKEVLAQAEPSRSVLLTLFRNPPLYQQLIARYLNQILPTQAELAAVLVKEYEIIDSVKGIAARCFFENIQDLGLARDGVFTLHDAEPSVPTVVATDEITDSSTAHITDTPANRAEDTTVEEHTGYYIEIPTLSKKPAKIILPDGLTRRDLEYIERYAKELFPLFLENLKEELEQE